MIKMASDDEPMFILIGVSVAILVISLVVGLILYARYCRKMRPTPEQLIKPTIGKDICVIMVDSEPLPIS